MKKLIAVLGLAVALAWPAGQAHANWYAGVVSGQTTYCNTGHTLTFNGDQCPGYQLRYVLSGCTRTYYHRGGTVYQGGGNPPYRWFVAAHLGWLYSHVLKVC